MKTHDIQRAKCPSCFLALDCATGLGHPNPPKPGSITICVQCAAVLTFTDTLGLERMTQETWEELDPQLQTSIQCEQIIIRRARAMGISRGDVVRMLGILCENLRSDH